LLHGIVGGHQRIDSVTVREVELMAPGVSTRDAQDLCGKVQFGSIFSAFSPQERTIIWENMLAYKSIISSLSKFFQDVLLLQACVNGVKRLFMVDPTETVLSALKRAFRAHDSKRSQLVQTTEDSFQTETGDSISCMMLGYLGMFAYFLRHYEDVPAEPTRKNAKTIPRPKADLGVLQRSAIFADQIGFESEKIKSLKGDLPHIPVRIAQGPVPILVTTGPGVSKKKRCGFPGENFKEDKQYLFLHNLFADKVETGEGITSFFVLKCWFISFFGWTRKPTSKECLKAPPQPPPPPPPPTQLVDGGDVAMGEAQPAPNQQVQDLPVDTDEKMQETTQLTQERMSGPAIEANQGIEEEDTLFGNRPLHNVLIWLTGNSLVPTEPPPQTQTTEAVNKKIIRFVELTGNESDMSDPLQAPLGVKRPVQLVEVEDGDPNSRVAQQVHEYFLKGKRVCDKHKKYILGEECYAVATEKENQNTLFVIPNAELQGDVKGKVSETSEWGAQAMTGLRDHKAGQEITQEPERERQLTEGGEDHTTPQPNQEDEALLGSEQENAANAHILGETIIIHLKRLADSHDVMKPDKDWVWEDMEPMIVPIGDPQELVKQKLGQYRHEMHLRPYDGNHKALEYGDCYKVAAKAEDHALYMLPEALPWHTLPPALHWHEESKRGRLYEPPRMQEETNWKNSTFAPQLDVPLLPPQQKPVVSAPEVHWNILPLPPEPEPKPEQLVGSIMGVHKPSDELAKFIAEVSSPPRSSRQKLVKSTIEAAPPLPPPSKQQPPLVRSSKEKHRDKLAGERENKVGLSFQAEEIGIRKKPDKMRVTQESEDDPPEKSSQDRKYAKARNPRSGGTGMVLDSKVTEGGVDHDMGEALGSGTLEGDGEIL
jgi:hypothetical protein